jgi:DNA-binding NarL/FixJ family response regulator
VAIVSGSDMTVSDPVAGALKFRALTEREQQVSALVCNGLSNKEIARELALCEGTVKLHLHSVYRKLGVQNRSGLSVALLNPKNQRDSNGRRT